MKKEMADRAFKTKTVLETLPQHQRIAMEGYRPGTYLRLRFTGKAAHESSANYNQGRCRRLESEATS